MNMQDLQQLISARTRAFLAQPKRMLIGARWADAANGATIPVFEPSTGQEIARIPDAQSADIDAAVAAARAAFEDSAWSRMRPHERERCLLKLADLVEANADELAQIESLDNGKSVGMARFGDCALVSDFLRYMAGWATKIEGASLEVSVPYMPGAQFHAYTRKEPVGVVAAVIPWNFPLLMAAWKIGPALAAGCTVVLKPAEDTSLSALRLGELILEAGIPAGVVNIITGVGATVGAALVAHKGIDKIAFTGSTAIGKAIGRVAMDNMTRVSLELGGKSPVIVLEDADPVQAGQGAAQAIFFNHGQVCTAGSRLYVQRKNFDRVIEEVTKAAEAIKLGPGLAADTQMGPLVSEKQMQRVCGYIDSGRAQGAKVVTGGARDGTAGFFVKPTVLIDVKPQMRVVQEEIFGPVLVAMPFDSIEEVAHAANATEYGLAASIWSNNLAEVHRLVPKIKAGTVWVNCHNVLDPNLPFGGYKQSGIGREMGRGVLDMYTETKSVLMLV